MKRNDNRFGTIEAVQKIGVSFERLRYWEQAGIVKPIYVQCGTRKYRRYLQEDIKRAQFVRMLVDDEKYSLEGAVIKLKAKEPLKDLLEKA